MADCGWVQQVEEVAAGFTATEYTTELLWVERPDGVRVPVHLAHHNKLYKQDGQSPVLLLAYAPYAAPQ